MNDMQYAYQSLVNGIEQYVKQMIEKTKYDITTTGIVQRIVDSTTYDILINGNVYKNIKTIGGQCQVNETVNVLIKQGNYNNMIILKGGDVTQSGEGGSVSSVNGKTGIVTLNYVDVDALPSDTEIPSALSDLTEDENHRTITETLLNNLQEATAQQILEWYDDIE